MIDARRSLEKSVHSEVAAMTRRRRQILEDMGFEKNLELMDMVNRLKSMRHNNLVLKRQLGDKDKIIAEKDNIISEKDRIIAEKDELIRKLTGGDSKTCVKTSNNSSVPPSRNPIGIKHTRSLREKSGRKTGGQKGHEGHTLDIGNFSVSETIKWMPSSVCPECGHSVDVKHLENGETRYVIDIPTSVLVRVTEHISMIAKCEDGHVVKGIFPEGINTYVSYGENLMAFVSYLSTYANVPFRKISSTIDMLFGIRLSDGTISNMLNRMRKLGKKPYEMIREAVAKNAVVGADETGANVNGKNGWVWAFQTEAATFLTYDESRGRKVITDNFTSEELERMILETDRWPSYFTEDVSAGGHQICLAHLLRNLVYCTEAYPNQTWSTDMLELLRDAIHRRHESKENRLPAAECAKYRRRLDDLLDMEITAELPEKNELTLLKESIGKYRDYIFVFLSNPNVHPTNNNSEKALRPVKTKLKVSGCFRSKDGADNYVTIASVLQTAVKNGENPLGALRAVAHLAYE